MADKNPIGHSVKGSNGRDVHTLRLERQQGEEGRDGKGSMKDTHPEKQRRSWISDELKIQFAKIWNCLILWLVVSKIVQFITNNNLLLFLCNTNRKICRRWHCQLCYKLCVYEFGRKSLCLCCKSAILFFPLIYESGSLLNCSFHWYSSHQPLFESACLGNFLSMLYICDQNLESDGTNVQLLLPSSPWKVQQNVFLWSFSCFFFCSC